MTEDRFRDWVKKNAYTVIFLAVMFVVTWVIQVLVTYVL